MARWTWLFVALLALMALTGCLTGTPADEASQTSVMTTPTSDSAASSPTQPSVATFTPYDCPYYLSVERIDGTTQRSIDRSQNYSNLSTERQSEFRTTLENGDTELGMSLPEEWSSPVIVAYEDERYIVSAFVC